MRIWMSRVLQVWAARFHVASIEQLERDNAELKAALSSERSKTAALSMVEAQNVAHTTRIAELEQELAETDAALRVAQRENTLLAEIHEEDVARRRRQRAIYDRDRAIATAATRPAQDEESE